MVRQRGHSDELVVFWRELDGGAREAKVGIHLASGQWAYLGLPARAPFPLSPLVAYLTLMFLGIVLIAIYAGSIIMRPLIMLEGTVSRVGADGMIPELPEKGPAEVRDTASAINRLSARLNTAIASRMRLVAAAGHDMRTPMTRMRLRAEFVADPEERGAWLADLDELDHMADSAIRLVREEVGGTGAAPLRLDAVVAELIQEMADMGSPIAITGSLPRAEVMGAVFAVKRALRNLLVNAVTHGVEAQVSMKVSDATVMLRILDKGPGIPPELITRVFEPFFRVDQARRQTIPGAGLGLAIAREIIEKHGGTIWIGNRANGGLEQLLTLPLKR